MYDFSKTHNLVALNLSNNSSIRSLECLPSSLVNLSISGCSVSEVSGCMNLSNLVFLDASNNSLLDVSGLIECHKLERLLLCSNKINNIYMILRIVKKCTNLYDFDAR